MSPVIVACVLAACLIPHGSVAQERQPTSAPATTTPAEDICQLPPYNIRNLTREAYWFTNVTTPQICSDANASSCTLYFSFCKALKLPFNVTHCHGSAVCLVGRNAAGKELYDLSLGQFVMNETQFYETNDTESGSFYMEVKSSTTDPQCNNTGFSTRIVLVCDPSVQWRTPNLTGNDTSNVELDGKCSYKITLHYAGACLPNNPSTSIPAPTPSPTPAPTTASSATATSTTVGPTNSSSVTVGPTNSSKTVSPESMSVPSPGVMTVSVHTGSSSPTSQTTQSHTGTRSGSVGPPTTPSVTPTSRPLPPHTTSEHPNPPTTSEKPTKPNPSTSEPTANPLASKVSGLTAGIVIFALLFFAMLLVAIGLVWYFKFHKSRYHKLPNEDL